MKLAQRQRSGIQAEYSVSDELEFYRLGDERSTDLKVVSDFEDGDGRATVSASAASTFGRGPKAPTPPPPTRALAVDLRTSPTA